jgi:F0F1-type ATP synthase delta subunit
LGRKVAFRVSTDPSLLAGVRVTVSGVTYDGTLKAQLEQLKDKISMASVTA